jgi:hypothetical protein
VAKDTDPVPRFGAAAVDDVARGKHRDLIGLIRDEITATPLGQVAGKKKAPDLRRFQLAPDTRQMRITAASELENAQ